MWQIWVGDPCNLLRQERVWLTLRSCGWGRRGKLDSCQRLVPGTWFVAAVFCRVSVGSVMIAIFVLDSGECRRGAIVSGEIFFSLIVVMAVLAFVLLKVGISVGVDLRILILIGKLGR